MVPMIFSIECEDDYEAEKLAGMTAVQKDGSTFIAGLSTLLGSEIILKLRDGSSHSVVLASEEDAVKLQKLIQAVADGKFAVSSSSCFGRRALIELVARPASADGISG